MIAMNKSLLNHLQCQQRMLNDTVNVLEVIHQSQWDDMNYSMTFLLFMENMNHVLIGFWS